MSQVFEIISGSGRTEIVLLCDHASNCIPPEFDDLGLGPDVLRDHVAIDIGVDGMARIMAPRLNATAVLARFSRLLIDPNREPDDESLIPEVSDGIIIPGNQGLGAAERAARMTDYYDPYHQACTEAVDGARARDHRPLVIGLHSFTPHMKTGTPRPWHVGLMWDTDPRLSRAIASHLEVDGFRVGYNDPYSGRGLFHSVRYHGGAEKLPHTQIEVRQDLVSDDAGVAEWAARLGDIVEHLAEEF